MNVAGTEALARAAAAQGVRRLVFVSTAKVNGESTSGRPFAEGDPPDPQNPTRSRSGRPKKRCDPSLRRPDLKSDRPAAAGVWPGVRANFLRLMQAGGAGLPLPLPDTNNRRSLIGVENLADFLVRCVSHPGAANETFMVSDGEDVSTRELIARLARALGRSSPIPAGPRVRGTVRRATGRERGCGRQAVGVALIDSDKARQRLGWKPPVTLDSGLAATARWYLESSRRLA